MESFLIFYKNLSQLVKERKTNQVDSVRLCSAINKLNTDRLEIIYTIIVHYYLQEQKKPSLPSKDFIPYQGNNSDGYRAPMFDLNNLPLELQCIIEEYVSRQK